MVPSKLAVVVWLGCWTAARSSGPDARNSSDVQADSEFHVMSNFATLVMGRDSANYDCDSDGVMDCGKWDSARAQCENESKCKYKYKFLDLTFGQSCRCRDKAVPPAVTDYDCNGDGKDECGKWEFSKLSCANPSLCRYRYKFPDFSLGQSCRCRTEPADDDDKDDSVKLDYDCDRDGTRDCGKWNYRMGTCENKGSCGHRYKFPDLTLDQSCRCLPCSGAAANTAQADANLKGVKEDRFTAVQFKALYWKTFRNWGDHVITCNPWIMPKTDDDIRGLLQYAKQRGYKVRMSGAAHSAGGIVTEGKDPNVVVMSLAEYTAPGEWQFALHDMPDGTKRATVNAGWTQFDLFERIRPLNLFVPAQTAGYFFSLAGIVANSVHGGGYGSGFIHGYVTRMRVMNYAGEIMIIDKEAELRYWRCSFGLLGIILGVEFRLEPRDHLQMYVTDRKLDAWSEEEFWKFIKGDAEANLPPQSVPAAGGSGSRKSFNGEFFVDFMNGGDRPRIQVYAQKANSSVNMNFDGSLGAPSHIAQNYEDIGDETVSNTRYGSMTWEEAARRYGAPPVEILGINVNDAIGVLKGAKLPMAKVMSWEAMNNVKQFVDDMSDKVNDGFFLTQSPAALAAAYFVPPENGFRAVDYLRKAQLDSKSSDDFVWNLPGEFRFVNVEDRAVLQPVPAGMWFNTQMISFADLAANEQAWKKAFKQVEDYWVKELNAKPHMGKLYGFEADTRGYIEPFGDSFTCKIYADEVKATFETYRALQDPDGLFATGLGMKFLAKCEA